MNPILRMICMRVIGIALSVVGAIVLALVWMNMGSIIHVIKGEPISSQVQQNETKNQSNSEVLNNSQNLPEQISAVAKKGTGNLAVNKAHVDDAAKKISLLDSKMDALIAQNHDVSYAHWPVLDQREYSTLENRKKAAINEYNSAAIKVNKSSSDMQSDIIGLLGSIIPSHK